MMEPKKENKMNHNHDNIKKDKKIVWNNIKKKVIQKIIIILL